MSESGRVMTPDAVAEMSATPRLTAEQVDRLAVLLRPHRHLLAAQRDEQRTAPQDVA